jgi:hypothetical protein
MYYWQLITRFILNINIKIHRYINKRNVTIKIGLCIYIYEYIHKYMHIRIYIHIYICIYIYIYTYFFVSHYFSFHPWNSSINLDMNITNSFKYQFQNELYFLLINALSFYSLTYDIWQHITIHRWYVLLNLN